MNKGFTLVELAIVLVILGLLAGGVMYGQNLIRAAELRSIVKDHENIRAAIFTFREKYMELPGDASGATRFWSRQTASAWCITNSAASVGTPGACDGDQDGMIESGPMPSQASERFQFWRHLANAGLIEGSYTGIAGSASSGAHDPGTNTLAGNISGTGWSAYGRGVFAGMPGQLFAGDYGNELYFIRYLNSVGVGVLTAEEVWGIDKKMDDGKPATGSVVVWNIGECTTAGTGAGSQNNLQADYLLTSQTSNCAIWFVKQF